MIGEKICFAVVFIVEAMIACLYLEYILSRKKSLGCLVVSFGIGYSTLFALSFLDIITVHL